MIADIAIRFERTEVMSELPLINRTKLISEVPEHARSVYNEEVDKLVNILNTAAIDGTGDSFKNNASIMQSLMAMRQIVGLAKVNTTVDYAQEFLEETDRKLVIFVHHKKCGELILEQMTKWCSEQGMTAPLSMTADKSPQERFSIQESFNGPNHRLMIASTLASGEGLNLQTCSDCVMHERQWNPANEEQAEGRFIRIGQQAKQVNAVYVHGDDTVDTELDRIVETKRVQFHNAMNKGEMPIWNEGNLIKELVNNIVNKRNKEKR
jgi:SNF2 family DNA or RNA helicase